MGLFAKITNLLPDRLVPEDIPKGLILTLAIVIVLMSLSAYRYGRGDFVQGSLHVVENWVLYLVLIPSCTAFASLPIKYRDVGFDVRILS